MSVVMYSNSTSHADFNHLSALLEQEANERELVTECKVLIKKKIQTGTIERYIMTLIESDKLDYDYLDDEVYNVLERLRGHVNAKYNLV